MLDARRGRGQARPSGTGSTLAGCCWQRSCWYWSKRGSGCPVNLYLTAPAHHPGAHPANYFAGSLHSVAWAIAHGAATLAVHTTLGLALVVFVVGTAGHALRSGRRAIAGWSVLGGLFVIGAGFNGASFLDFAHNINSLIMALLALAAIGCYATALMLLGAPSTLPGSEMTRPAG